MDTSKWFDPRLTVGEIKAHYRQLAMDHHPDLHPELGQVPMQEINAAYHAALLARDGETSIGSDQKEHAYRYNQATESEMVAKFYAAVAARMGGVTLEIIGTWPWARPISRMSISWRPTALNWQTTERCTLDAVYTMRYNKGGDYRAHATAIGGHDHARLESDQ